MKKTTKIIIAVLLIQAIIFAVVVYLESQKPQTGNSVLSGIGVVIAIVATPLLFVIIFGLGYFIVLLSNLFRKSPKVQENEVANLDDGGQFFVPDLAEPAKAGKSKILGKLFRATLLFWPALFAVIFVFALLSKSLKESDEKKEEQKLVAIAGTIMNCLAESQSYYQVKAGGEQSNSLTLIDPEGKEFILWIGINSATRINYYNLSPTVFIQVKNIPDFAICDTLAWANFGLKTAKPFLADSIYQHLEESVTNGKSSFYCIPEYEQFSLHYSLDQAFAPFEMSLRSEKNPDYKNMSLLFSFQNCKNQSCKPEQYP